MRIARPQFYGGGVDFREAERGVAMEDLALQVRQRNGIEVEQRQLADARADKIGRGGAA